jgi:hypothetical protein
MKPLLPFLFLFFFGKSAFAQVKPEENKYSYGLKVNVINGKFDFKIDDFYDLKSFEPYLNKGFDAFAQVHFSKIFSMQIEFMMHKRDYFSKEKFEKIARDFQGTERPVFYSVDGKLKIRELGIYANFNVLKTKNFKYYLSGGGAIGLHPKPEIAQTYRDGTLLISKNIRASQPENMILLGTGFVVNLSPKMNVFVDFRYFWGNHYFKNDPFGTLTSLRGTIFSLGVTRSFIIKTM